MQAPSAGAARRPDGAHGGPSGLRGGSRSRSPASCGPRGLARGAADVGRGGGAVPISCSSTSEERGTVGGKQKRKGDGKQEPKLKKVKSKKKSKKKKKAKEKKRLEKLKRKLSKVKKSNGKAKKVSSSSSSSSSSPLPLASPADEFALAVERGDRFLAEHVIRRRGTRWRSAAGDGPLHIAVRRNAAPDLVAWLLRQPGVGKSADGIDADILDARNVRGETPVLLAARLFRGAIALLLVEALADVSIADASGEAAETLDLDGLLQETQSSMSTERRGEEDRVLVAVELARRRREESEWRERLFFETGLDEGEHFAGYDDLEQLESQQLGRDWMDDVRMQAEQRCRMEARKRMEERLRAVMEAKEAARERAKEQEAKARAAAAADAESRQRASSASGAASGGASPSAAGSGRAPAADGEARKEARLRARSEDEERWRGFEAALAQAEGGGSDAPRAQLRSRDIPWPSGPPGNPLRIDPAGHPAVVRAQLRAGLLRWHPDKFEQKVALLLPEAGGEREAVLAKVKDIAQQLTSLMSELSAAGAPGR